MSQKEQQLIEFKQAVDDYAIESNWQPLKFVSARLLEEGTPVPTNSNDTEDIIHNCALKHGLTATFMPKYPLPCKMQT